MQTNYRDLPAQLKSGDDHATETQEPGCFVVKKILAVSYINMI